MGTLFVNLFQCTDETINGTVTSVFIWQILWKKISDANKTRFTSKCSSNNENDVQHVTIHRIRVRWGPLDKRGWVYDSNQRTNHQPSPRAVFQTWPIPHRALIFALKIAFKRSHAEFSRYLFLKTTWVCKTVSLSGPIVLTQYFLTVDDELQTVDM